jgi:hypothetical protein
VISDLSVAHCRHAGNLYACGGSNENGDILRTVDVYHFEQEEWSALAAEMPTERAGHVSVVHANMLYVVGGLNPISAALGSADVYNFATEEWAMLPGGMAVNRSFACAVVRALSALYFIRLNGCARGGCLSDPTHNPVGLHPAGTHSWLQSKCNPSRAFPYSCPNPNPNPNPDPDHYTAKVHKEKVYILGAVRVFRQKVTLEDAIGFPRLLA